GLPGSVGKDLLEARLVGTDPPVTLSNRRQVFDQRIRDGLLEVSIAPPRELLLDRLWRHVANDREDVDQVGDAGLVRSPDDVGPRVGDGAAELPFDGLRPLEDQDRALWSA